MKAFSDASLKFINILFYLTFSRKTMKKATLDYRQEVNRSLIRFSLSIGQKGYLQGSSDHKRLRELFSTATIFRSNKKLVKRIFENLFVTPLLLGLIAIPYLVPYLFFEIHFPFWMYLLIQLGASVLAILGSLIVFSVYRFINNFEVKIGKNICSLSRFIFVTAVCLSGYYLYNSKGGVWDAIVISAYSLVFWVLAVQTTVFFIVEVIIDIFYFSKKFSITDALIIESSYRLSRMNWANALKKVNIRQNAVNEIERLASLTEKDWGSHIIAGDEKTNKWKTDTLLGIAAGFRKLKRQVIIPTTDTPKQLKEQFNNIYEKILKLDIQGLIDSEVPIGRIRKKTRLAALQSFFVAILPLSITLSIHFFTPELLNSTYINFSIIASGIWLLICTLLWMDPNLADKIAAIKSVKDVMKNNSGDL